MTFYVRDSTKWYIRGEVKGGMLCGSGGGVKSNKNTIEHEAIIRNSGWHKRGEHSCDDGKKEK